jgi:hypothetical protein
MNHVENMLRVLCLDEAVYREVITQNRLSLWYTAVNVGIFGLIYGLSSLYFSDRLLDSGAVTESLPIQLRVTLLLMGVSVAFLIHGGTALFSWVFCRGFGGSPLFLPVYLALGIAWISLWPVAPLLSAIQVKIGGGWVVVLLAATSAYGLAVFFRALKSASGLSSTRMGIVLAVVIIYIVSFMYLWVG